MDIKKYRCPSCGRPELIWYIRDDGSPIGDCRHCDDGLAGSNEDTELIEAVKNHVL